MPIRILRRGEARNPELRSIGSLAAVVVSASLPRHRTDGHVMLPPRLSFRRGGIRTLKVKTCLDVGRGVETGREIRRVVGDGGHTRVDGNQAMRPGAKQ